MTYQEAKEIKDNLYKELEEMSQALRTFPKGEMGLTPDSVKSSKEFQTAKQNFTTIEKKVKEFNSFFLKNFKKEYQKERNQKRKNLQNNKG